MSAKSFTAYGTFVMALNACLSSAVATSTASYLPNKIDQNHTFGTSIYEAQTFTAQLSGTLYQIGVAFYLSDAPNEVTMQLRTVGIDGAPTTSILATSSITSAQVTGNSNWNTTPTLSFFNFSSGGPAIVAGTKYAYVLSTPDADAGWSVLANYSNEYAGGSAWQSPDVGNSFISYGLSLANVDEAFDVQIVPEPGLIPAIVAFGLFWRIGRNNRGQNYFYISF
jgi:hypothetical protein